MIHLVSIRVRTNGIIREATRQVQETKSISIWGCYWVCPCVLNSVQCSRCSLEMETLWKAHTFLNTHGSIKNVQRYELWHFEERSELTPWCIKTIPLGAFQMSLAMAHLIKEGMSWEAGNLH